jgi:putative sigma-54 modulation protein
MQVSFTFRQYEATEDLKELIQGRIEKKLGLYVNGDAAEARVTIATEKAWTMLEIQVTAWGEVFKSAEKTTDLYPTIDVVVEKLERQLHRRKEMFRERRTRRA